MPGTPSFALLCEGWESNSCHNNPVYERYSEPARKAIYYATLLARADEAAYIDSVHLLKGIMLGDESRADTLFHLREHFPLCDGSPSKFAWPEGVPARETVVADGMKRILDSTAQEADLLGHSWIDTEHFVLGILKEGGSVAADYLGRTSLTLKEARRIVKENKQSQPGAGSPSLPLPEPPPYSLLGKLIHK